jgi:hypothetical protein
VVVFKEHGRHRFHGKHGFFRGQRFGTVSNHVIHPETRRVAIVQPGSRILSQLPGNRVGATRRGPFTNEEAQRGARSIFQRDATRGIRGDAARPGLSADRPGNDSLPGVSSGEGRSLSSGRETGFTGTRRGSMEDRGRSDSGRIRSSLDRPSFGAPLQTREGSTGGFQRSDRGRGFNRSSGAGFSSGRGAFSGGSIQGGSGRSLGGGFRSGGGGFSRGGGFSGGGGLSGGGTGGRGGGGGLSGGGCRGRC